MILGEAQDSLLWKRTQTRYQRLTTLKTLELFPHVYKDGDEIADVDACFYKAGCNQSEAGLHASFLHSL